MFDPVSLTAVVAFSLTMPFLSFVAVSVLLRLYKQVPSVGYRLLGSQKAKLYFSLRVGTLIPLLYLLPCVVANFAADKHLPLSGILVRVFTMIVLCVPGTYIGVVVAGWMFAPKAPDLPNKSS